MPSCQELEFWTDALRLPDFEVVHVERDAQTLVFTVIPELAVGVCPHCQKPSSEVRQKRTRERIRDLAIGTSSVELQVRTYQFQCEFCERAFTPPCPILAEGAHATERFLARAAVLIRTGDIANAAAFFGVPEKTLEKWYYDYVDRKQQQPAGPLQPIKSMGIDELSLKKSTGSSPRC